MVVLIGSNEFFIVGQAADPAKIATAKSATEAYQKIAAAQAKFYSRGDDSGTHKKEQSIWKMANIQPTCGWYIVTKSFMTATLKRANDEGGYFMTDSSTWAAEKKHMAGLKILFKGDKCSGEHLPRPGRTLPAPPPSRHRRRLHPVNFET